MRLLTGIATSSSEDSFSFIPHTIKPFGSTVLAEGRDPVRSVSWVHAWTVTDGVVTQVREYFNTSLIVTRLGDDSSQSPAPYYCLNSPLWESSFSGSAGKSMPGLVLGI
ncbi:wound-induced protein 1-like [Tasmannia lanceolata]|uniref:wound-induced protein 1-like n=1 Tax=Tasmannia lanceolata TaxID=3420 RepID=UPI004062A1D6